MEIIVKVYCIIRIIVLWIIQVILVLLYSFRHNDAVCGCTMNWKKSERLMKEPTSKFLQSLVKTIRLLQGMRRQNLQKYETPSLRKVYLISMEKKSITYQKQILSWKWQWHFCWSFEWTSRQWSFAENITFLHPQKNQFHAAQQLAKWSIKKRTELVKQQQTY